MIDSNLLLQWRAQYKTLYSTVVGNVEYVFRALTFREYDQLNADQIDIPDIEEMVIQMAVLSPVDIDFDRVKPGYITSLAEEIIEISGFSDIASARVILEQKREAAQSFRINMKAFVLATQPNTNEDSLDDLTFSELAEKVAMAERIIAIQQAIIGRPETGVQLEIIDPEEESAKEQAQQAEAFKGIDRKSVV